MNLPLAKIDNLNEGSFEVKTTGYLLEVKSNFSHINQVISEQGPSFDGNPDEFLQKYDNNPNLKDQLKNKIKKCPKCSKPVAFTLPFCNACGADIRNVEISYSNNIFTSFIFGIKSGPFPLKISVRYQDENFLAFDDLLALSTCHFNIIPTSAYIPDWRYLLKNPNEGLKIAESLFGKCVGVLEEQFANNEPWMNKAIKSGFKSLTGKQLGGHVAAGFNYPPSQYQLHLQFILPPFLPFQYHMYLEGRHFTQGRFFPYEYVVKVLQALQNKNFNFRPEQPIEELILELETHYGVNYNQIHAECYKRYQSSHQLLANWNTQDFESVVINGKAYKFNNDLSYSPHSTLTGDLTNQVNNDKLVLQNYGRPYADDKPTGSYYKFPKKPEQLSVW